MEQKYLKDIARALELRALQAERLRADPDSQSLKVLQEAINRRIGEILDPKR